MQRLETKHGPGNSFDETVVLFKNVIQVFDLQDFDEG